MSPSSDDLVHQLRRADPDRYFCTLFAPAQSRPALALLYLFNHELARAREVASEPILALIRLNWWREVVSGQVKHHEIATPLTQALNAGVFAREDLLGLITAREQEAEPEMPDAETFFAYARASAGRLARIAGKLLGADSERVEDLGTAYGISGILRAAPFLAARNRSLLPADGTQVSALVDHARGLLRNGGRPPRAVLPAALPAVFARRDLGRPYAPRTPLDRLAILRAAVTGFV
jgi:phytoene synthase